jgi:hypothetical protein
MAIKISGTTVIDNSRNITDVENVGDANTVYYGDGSNLTNLPASGGTADFVASGTIANGDTVVINSNGTVSTISGSGTVNPSAASEASIQSNTTYVEAAYDTANNRVVVFYSDSAAGNQHKAVVGTITGNTVSFGSPVTVYGGTSFDKRALYDPDNGRIIVLFKLASSAQLYSLTVNPSTNTLTTSGTAALGNTQEPDMAYDTANNKVVIVYKDAGNTNRGTAVVATVTSSTVSVGTPVIFETSGISSPSVTFDSVANKAVIAWLPTSTLRGTTATGTVSGTSISFGTKVQVSGNEPTAIACDYKPEIDRTVYYFPDKQSSSVATILLGKVSGTSISISKEFILPFASVLSTSTLGSLQYNPNNKSTTLVCRPFVFEDPYFVVAAEMIFDKNTLDVKISDAVPFGSATTTYINSVFNTSTNKINAIYIASSGVKATELTSSTFSSNYDGHNYIGVAAAAISNAATGTITIGGGVNESQSGLTVGREYYVDPSGGLTLDKPTSLPVVTKAGTSISATKLIVKG